jgi:uncharacterized protein YdeI (YjbR/CyaY-like superfamily)
MNGLVDKYLLDGCMRCKWGATPQCKVHSWRTELETLRQIALESSLTEEIKWGVPCYTLAGKNVVMISALKDYVCMSFFKGILLQDVHQIFTKQGENSQVWRILKYTQLEQIVAHSKLIKAYITEAIEVEKSGQKIEVQKNIEPLPEELLLVFEDEPALQKAFYALTVGKQRGYIIYFSQPKQATSRFNRIEKCKAKILNGEGLHDKYSR